MDSYQLGWLIGFIEGEGCFHVAFDHGKGVRRDKDPRRDWLIRPLCHIPQAEESPIQFLAQLLKGEGVNGGIIRQAPRGKLSAQWKFVTYNRASCLKLISLLEKGEWHTKKAEDFKKWANIVRLMEEGKHHYKDGFLEIARIASTMNLTGRPSRKLNHDFFLKLWDNYEWRARGGIPPEPRLRELYIQKNLTVGEIAQLYKTGRTTVAKWLRLSGIRIKSPGEAQTGRRKWPHSEEAKRKMSEARRKFLARRNNQALASIVNAKV